jgi:hypothetical protein
MFPSNLLAVTTLALFVFIQSKHSPVPKSESYLIHQFGY